MELSYSAILYKSIIMVISHLCASQERIHEAQPVQMDFTFRNHGSFGPDWSTLLREIAKLMQRANT